MKIDWFPLGPLQVNSFLVTCKDTGKSVIIDPGGTSPALNAALEATDLTAVVLTHGHFDHIGGVDDITGRFDVPIMIHSRDEHMLYDPAANGSQLFGEPLTVSGDIKLMSENDIITFGNCGLRVIHTPGHTQGCVSLIGDGLVFSGDTLFRGAVGRWDLPGGDYSVLMQSLRDTFIGMDDNIEIYPGHGESTTIAHEKRTNPFLLNLIDAR